MDLETVDKLLTTTRVVRRRLDLNRPVEPELIEECLEIAIQAPTGGNTQSWHFLIITDPIIRAKIGELYLDSFYTYAQSQEDQDTVIGNPGPLHQSAPSQQMRLAQSSLLLR